MENPKKNKFCVALDKKVFYLKREIKSAKITSELKFYKKGYAEFIGNNNFKLKPKAGKIHKINKKICLLKYLQSDITKALSDILSKNRNIVKNTENLSNCVIFRPIFEFIYWYFIKLAIFEGKRGLIYSRVKAIEKFILETMKYEKKAKESL